MSETEPQPRPPEGLAPPQVLIVGASTRAAAFSAIRAGMQPICLDQFADRDLQAVARVQTVEGYPGGLTDLISQYPNLPVVYTGAMENHPDVLADIAARQPLIGNDIETLAAVRDPFRVREVLADVKMAGLEVRSSDDRPTADGQWMLKPLNGGAGRGVVVWDDAAVDSPTLAEPHYFQQRAEGETVSAVYIASQDPVQVRYVGLTRQLIGRPELNALPFAWCGSIGPFSLDTRGEILARRTGTVLAHQLGLRGLYGVDFVISKEGEPLLTEVNPRYTASVDVLEVLIGTTLFEEHCRAAGLELPEGMTTYPVELPTGAVAGKVVMFADRNLIAPDTSQWTCATPITPLPGLSDVPMPGTVIPQGAPVCTMMTAATTFALCEQQLFHSAAEVQRHLDACVSPTES